MTNRVGDVSQYQLLLEICVILIMSVFRFSSEHEYSVLQGPHPLVLMLVMVVVEVVRRGGGGAAGGDEVVVVVVRKCR